MEELKVIMEDVNTAYKLISELAVKGDAVDLIASARGKLRHVYAELKKMEEGERNGTDAE